MVSTHTTLDAAANERKARLAKLAAVKRKQAAEPEVQERDAEDDAGQDAKQDTKEPTSESEPNKITSKYLSGRNYDIEADAPRLGFDTNLADAPETIEQRAKVLADETKAVAEKEKSEDKPLDLFAIQPKKPNWDLKRDLAQKMDILNQRTDNAIARIVRERVGAGSKNEGPKTSASRSATANGAGESISVDGIDLVQSIHEREREGDQDERAQADMDQML